MDLKLIIKLRVRVKVMALIVNCSDGIQSIAVKLVPTSSEADVAMSLNLKNRRASLHWNSGDRGWFISVTGNAGEASFPVFGHRE